MNRTTMLGGMVAIAAAWIGGCGGGETTGTGGGTTTATTASGGAGGGSDTYGAGPCRECVATACADEIDACKADPECPAFLTCLDACPVSMGGDAEAACVDACPTGSGTESKKAAAEINACREKGPGVACTACGLTVSTAFTAPALTQMCAGGSTDPNPCFACIDDKCCETYQACQGSADCQALKACLNACSDAACVDGCAASHPEGSGVWGPYYACGIVRCATEQTMCDVSARDACQACFYGDCGDPYAYFLSAPGGYEMLACIQVCAVDDTVCDQACYDAHPEAYALYGDLAACAAVVCKGKC